MKMSKKEKTVLTKTQKRSLFRWFLNGGASLNYERMMSMAYTYSMLPWLKENYKGNPEGLKKSVKTHLQYYNCSPYMNPYVMGVNMGIEGQGKENSLDAVMAINDEVATNPTLKTVLRMAAPPNVSTSIITRETAVTNIKAGKYTGQKVLVVVKSPFDILYLIDQGLDIKTVNVGNMSARENTEHLRPTISVTPEEKEAFKELLDKGVEITTILVPSAPKSYLKDSLA